MYCGCQIVHCLCKSTGIFYLSSLDIKVDALIIISTWLLTLYFSDNCLSYVICEHIGMWVGRRQDTYFLHLAQLSRWVGIWITISFMCVSWFCLLQLDPYIDQLEISPSWQPLSLTLFKQKKVLLVSKKYPHVPQQSSQQQKKMSSSVPLRGNGLTKI